MLRHIFKVLFFAFISFETCSAQFSTKIDSLINIYNKAITDSDKVIACGKIAEYYYTYQLDKKGDSVLQQQLKIAELSQNTNLILATYFGNAILNINKWAKNETFDRALQFIGKGLEYSKAHNLDAYLALSYIRTAYFYRLKGDLGNAFTNADIATVISQNLKNDSIKILATLVKGDVYQDKGESLLAFKTFTNAFDNAAEIENIYLESEAYHRFASLFRSLNNNVTAKDYLLKSLELNTKYKNGDGLIRDHIELARLTDERFHIEKALQLSDSLRLEKYYIQAKGLMFGYYTVKIMNSDSTLQFLRNNPDLTQTWVNTGMPFYYLNIGSVYHYAHKLDSAIYYLLLAVPGFEKDFKERNQQDLYEEIAQCYALLKKPQEAILYYEKALTLNLQISSLTKAVTYTETLSELYGEVKNYQKAFYYSANCIRLKDSVQKLSNQRDIALAEVNNEKRNHERELEIIAGQKLTKRNLQYMAITIFITGFFFMLIIIGMLPVSRITVKLLGYFTFISLFEFIILLIDPLLHDLTHGEPLKIWLIKIFLIAILVPFQHFLEHGLVRYIEKRKKKYTFSIKRWWFRPKKPTEKSIDEMEGDTAIL